jgi:hypothetical protein
MHQLSEIAKRLFFAIGMVASIILLGRAVGFGSPWLGLIASFCVLGILDLAMPFIRLRLPQALREVRAWELRGGVYRTLGVPVFGRVLRRSPLRLLNRKVYLRGFARDLTAVRLRLEETEAAHFWGGLVTLPYLGFAWTQAWWSNLTCVMLFDVVVNIYPIFHLRAMRGRIEQALLRGRSLYARKQTA